MISRDGVLVGVVWIVFTLLFAIATVGLLNPLPSLFTLKSLLGPKLIFFSVIIAIAIFEYRSPRAEAKEQLSSLYHSFVTIISLGLLFSLLFTVSIDIAQAYTQELNSFVYNLSFMLFITSIYFILTLMVAFLYTMIIERL